MSLRVRAFRVHDDGVTGGTDSGDLQDEKVISAFLTSVQVERIETAYADGAWHLLVLFHDRKDQEEAAQIASAVASALREWRAVLAASQGRAATDILGDDLLERVALAVPTTTIELAALVDGGAGTLGPHAADIVHVVKSVLDDLT